MSAVYLEYIYLGLDLLIGCSGRSSPSDKGGGGGRGRASHPDPEIRGGGSLQKIFSALWASFWSKYKGGAWAPWPPPLDLPLGCCVILVNKIPLTLLNGW